MVNASSMSQLPAAQRFQIGGFVVTAISDGYSPFNPANFVGVTDELLETAFRRAYVDRELYRSALNAFVIDTGSQLILVDSGGGDFIGPTLGRLETNLRAAGYDPAGITTLLMTHLHPDHVGGSVKEGEAVFPNAEFVVSETEHAHWNDPAIRARGSERAQRVFNLVQSAFAAYAGRLRIIADNGEALPGVTAVPLPGHTPGHIGYRIESGGKSLLIWGDIVHAAPIQLFRPEVTVIFDVDPAQAVETRKALLEQVAGERTLVAGMHTPFPGLGYIEALQDGYRFLPAAWQYIE